MVYIHLIHQLSIAVALQTLGMDLSSFTRRCQQLKFRIIYMQSMRYSAELLRHLEAKNHKWNALLNARGWGKQIPNVPRL